MRETVKKNIEFLLFGGFQEWHAAVQPQLRVELRAGASWRMREETFSTLEEAVGKAGRRQDCRRSSDSGGV